MCVCARACVLAGVCACVHYWLNELVSASEFVLCICVFLYLCVVSAQQTKVLRRKHPGTGHVDHVTPMSFTSYIFGSMSSTSHSDLTGPFLPKTLTKTKSHPRAGHWQQKEHSEIPPPDFSVFVSSHRKQ